MIHRVPYIIPRLQSNRPLKMSLSIATPVPSLTLPHTDLIRQLPRPPMRPNVLAPKLRRLTEHPARHVNRIMTHSTDRHLVRPGSPDLDVHSSCTLLQLTRHSINSTHNLLHITLLNSIIRNHRSLNKLVQIIPRRKHKVSKSPTAPAQQ